MKKQLWLLLTVLVITEFSEAQTRYVVKFRDKGSNPYALNAPGAYLSQRAIDRRTRYAIPLDSADLPVTPRYVDSIRLSGTVTILNVSKWLNSVSIQTSDAAALTKINSFTFVQSVSSIAARTISNGSNDKYGEEHRSVPLKQNGLTANFFDYGSSFSQLHLHNGEFLHNIGLRGQNMAIGILDGGFQGYLSFRAFDSVRLNGQILDTWDFVAGESSVNEDHPHGMQCFSIIASNIPGEFIGSAPKANFYLFRSEDAGTEYPVEEHNWVCAAERVDSSGGDVISSSLGYGDAMSNPSFDHTYAQMDGNTTMAAIGADLAAKKGILVVNAAGNEGSGSWHFILTPADADSVMVVGAVNSSGAVANFSSYGPSSDGQIKPDVASVGVGTIIQTTLNTVGSGNGTSYACPNMAGLTTCLWQGFQEYNNMKIINALRQASTTGGQGPDRIGYGVPDVKKAVMNLLKEFATSTATVNSCRTTLTWKSKDMTAMKYEVERMLEGQSGFTKIGEKQGTGSVFATHTNLEYEDVLVNVNPGTISYRVRQVIDTAAASFAADYIDTTTVTLTVGCTATGVGPVTNIADAITLMPNPATSQFVLKITTADAIQNLLIRIINSKGQEVSLMKQSKMSGTANIDVPVGRFAKGKYYVMVYNGEKLIATKELLKL